MQLATTQASKHSQGSAEARDVTIESFRPALSERRRGDWGVLLPADAELEDVVPDAGRFSDSEVEPVGTEDVAAAEAAAAAAAAAVVEAGADD